MGVFTLTDKKDTKQIPCAFPGGCEHEVIVTKFLAPSKARCPEHAGGKKGSEVKVAKIEEQQEKADPNLRLGRLCCPYCETPLQINDVDGERVGFRCKKAGCSTYVTVHPGWAALVIPVIRGVDEADVGVFNSLQTSRIIRGLESELNESTTKLVAANSEIEQLREQLQKERELVEKLKLALLEA